MGKGPSSAASRISCIKTPIPPQQILVKTGLAVSCSASVLVTVIVMTTQATALR